MSNPISPFDNQSAKFLSGLVGRNILASRSPWIHESEADAQNVRMVYSLFDFNALGLDDAALPDILKSAQLLGFAGLNITFPFKQAVISYLDVLAPGAAQLGAVNSVQFIDGKMIGHNTDVIGFGDNLSANLPDAELDCVVQFGAGGAGAATAHALLDLGTRKLFIAENDGTRRDALIANLQNNFGAERVIAATDITAALGEADGVVNATPMGMVTHPGAPFDTDLLRASQWVADIVYFPLETELLLQARLRGCATVDGGGMATLQAAAAFDIFTGLTADRERMLKKFVEYVSLPVSRAA